MSALWVCSESSSSSHFSLRGHSCLCPSTRFNNTRSSVQYNISRAPIAPEIRMLLSIRVNTIIRHAEFFPSFYKIKARSCAQEGRFVSIIFTVSFITVSTVSFGRWRSRRPVETSKIVKKKKLMFWQKHCLVRHTRFSGGFRRARSCHTTTHDPDHCRNDNNNKRTCKNTNIRMQTHGKTSTHLRDSSNYVRFVWDCVYFVVIVREKYRVFWTDVTDFPQIRSDSRSRVYGFRTFEKLIINQGRFPRRTHRRPTTTANLSIGREIRST